MSSIGMAFLSTFGRPLTNTGSGSSGSTSLVGFGSGLSTAGGGAFGTIGAAPPNPPSERSAGVAAPAGPGVFIATVAAGFGGSTGGVGADFTGGLVAAVSTFASGCFVSGGGTGACGFAGAAA